MFRHNESSSAAGHTENDLPTPSVKIDAPISGVDNVLIMTYYVETPEMGVSILSDGVGKPFSVHPAADDDLIF